MSRHHAADIRPMTRVAVLACALLAAPALSAEPYERSPGADGSGERRAAPGVGAAPDFLTDLLPGQCNGAKFGAIAGATLGGVLGARIADGHDSALATTAGSLIGMSIGSSIGKSSDDGDANCRPQPLPPHQQAPDSGGEIDADHEGRDTDRWSEDQPGLRAYRLQATLDHQAPVGRRWRNAETEKGQRGHEQQGTRRPQGELDREQIGGIRHHLPDDDSQRAFTSELGRLHVALLHDDDADCPRRADHAHHVDEAHNENENAERLTKSGHEQRHE